MSRRTPHDRLLRPQQGREEQEPEPRMEARQVRRRRLHTRSRPFQERQLLDMAEARREIAAALRTRRAAAAMRRSGDQHEQQLSQLQQQQQEHVQWHRCDAFFSNHLCDSPLADSMAAGASYSSSSTLRYLAPVSVAPPLAIGGGIDHLACSLQQQPLGLSLSFQSFAGSSVHDDAKNSDDSCDRPLIQPSSDSSCSARASPLAAAMLSHGRSPAVGTAKNATSSRAPLQPVLEGDQEEEGMAAVYPIGERRSAEWSDDGAVDVASSARRDKLLGQSMVMEDGGDKLGRPAWQEGGAVGVTWAVAGTPAAGWPCDGTGEPGITGSGKPDGGLETHLDGGDDYYCCHQGRDGDGDGEEITFPCMEIGEIEGWDREWFS